MCIAVDAMGGDFAPRVPVEGACLAARSLGVSITLVGKASLIRKELERIQPAPPDEKVSLVDTPEWIEMGESPATALRTKKSASVLLAAGLAAKGKAQAMVSAGNSGAAMVAAMRKMRTLPGVERPAIAIVMPNKTGQTIFLDAGATVDCRPQNLLQFAHMGVAYALCRLGVEKPRVGLLGIGEEPTKGNSLTREAHQLLRKSGLNFVGNVEPNEMMEGVADVVVCDGFVGNIALKTMEGFAEFALQVFAGQFGSEEGASAEMQPHIEAAKRHIDWAEYGGALLLGVNGLCVISHGRSTPTAIARAIQLGKEASEKQVITSLSRHLLPLQGEVPAGKK
ncbi:MAG: phosphate acyltransferase PlsX [Armatimonadetes bacterium]|nr:phosphate acyltransferase PlsX [Armatimonadota bacterium]NIM23593.1 phosphate acyltransferase PlsX [Armatimonadota bacterium]NIM67459.1 phosphate acyltransferase PlsX [Armatimonadota bacterium]NIM75956.1 phosphate acyltransferase PlsX [Armatimonadota bacterium]NIN05645.1 phosphate acyltransferase PlsX [Armatimonadota bacterium]